MLPPLVQYYANKHIFTTDRHKKVKKINKGKFTLLANEYWVVEIPMSCEQNLGTYKRYKYNEHKLHRNTHMFFKLCYLMKSAWQRGMPML